MASSPLAVEAVGCVMLIAAIAAFLWPLPRLSVRPMYGNVYTNVQRSDGTTEVRRAHTCACGTWCMYEFVVSVFVGAACLLASITVTWGALALPDPTDVDRVELVAKIFLGSAFAGAILFAISGRDGWRLHTSFIVVAFVTAALRSRTSDAPEGSAFLEIPVLRALVVVVIVIAVGALMAYTKAEWVPHAICMAVGIVGSAAFATGDWVYLLRAYRYDLTVILIEIVVVFCLYAVYEQQIYTCLQRRGRRPSSTAEGG